MGDERKNSKGRCVAIAALITASWVLTSFDRVVFLVVAVICYIVGALLYVVSLSQGSPLSACDSGRSTELVPRRRP